MSDHLGITRLHVRYVRCFLSVQRMVPGGQEPGPDETPPVRRRCATTPAAGPADVHHA
ncbi:hypothetical protein ABZ733_00510 [Streptomyces longwoodensis]|uniref:hypothetical protein n=1 Tax=Streptomyces longwoodensis TaxID=68231 RepID=UPI0033F939E3